MNEGKAKDLNRNFRKWSSCTDSQLHVKRCSTSFVCVLGGGMPTKITWRFGGDGNNANKKWAKDVKRCFTSRKIRGQQISSSVAAVLM